MRDPNLGVNQPEHVKQGYSLEACALSAWDDKNYELVIGYAKLMYVFYNHEEGTEFRTSTDLMLSMETFFRRRYLTSLLMVMNQRIAYGEIGYTPQRDKLEELMQLQLGWFHAERPLPPDYTLPHLLIHYLTIPDITENNNDA